jgi:hypothetical protein
MPLSIELRLYRFSDMNFAEFLFHAPGLISEHLKAGVSVLLGLYHLDDARLRLAHPGRRCFPR